MERALRSERERTLGRLDTLESQFRDIVAYSEVSPPDDEHDPEGATIGFERAQISALLDQTRAHLAEIDAASERVTNGSYGMCESCGRPIAPERLEARPYARSCAACS